MILVARDVVASYPGADPVLKQATCQLSQGTIKASQFIIHLAVFYPLYTFQNFIILFGFFPT